jgi:hypothetical protein
LFFSWWDVLKTSSCGEAKHNLQCFHYPWILLGNLHGHLWILLHFLQLLYKTWIFHIFLCLWIWK